MPSAKNSSTRAPTSISIARERLRAVWPFGVRAGFRRPRPYRDGSRREPSGAKTAVICSSILEATGSSVTMQLWLDGGTHPAGDPNAAALPGGYHQLGFQPVNRQEVMNRGEFAALGLVRARCARACPRSGRREMLTGQVRGLSSSGLAFMAGTPFRPARQKPRRPPVMASSG